MNLYEPRDKMRKPLLSVTQVSKCICITKMPLTSPDGIFFPFRRVKGPRKTLITLYVTYTMHITGFLLD